MLESSKDYLSRKAAHLGLSRGDILVKVQRYLDKLFADETRALSLQDGVLKVITPSSVVASELRLRQVEIIGQIQTLAGADQPIEKLNIQIRTLDRNS